jgi:hypothetical protein
MQRAPSLMDRTIVVLVDGNDLQEYFCGNPIYLVFESEMLYFYFMLKCDVVCFSFWMTNKPVHNLIFACGLHGIYIFATNILIVFSSCVKNTKKYDYLLDVNKNNNCFNSISPLDTHGPRLGAACRTGALCGAKAECKQNKCTCMQGFMERNSECVEGIFRVFILSKY